VASADVWGQPTAQESVRYRLHRQRALSPPTKTCNNDYSRGIEMGSSLATGRRPQAQLDRPPSRIPPAVVSRRYAHHRRCERCGRCFARPSATPSLPSRLWPPHPDVHVPSKPLRTPLKAISASRQPLGSDKVVRTFKAARTHILVRAALPRRGDRGLNSCPLPPPLGQPGPRRIPAFSSLYTGGALLARGCGLALP